MPTHNELPDGDWDQYRRPSRRRSGASLRTGLLFLIVIIVGFVASDVISHTVGPAAQTHTLAASTSKLLAGNTVRQAAGQSMSPVAVAQRNPNACDSVSDFGCWSCSRPGCLGPRRLHRYRQRLARDCPRSCQRSLWVPAAALDRSRAWTQRGDRTSDRAQIRLLLLPTRSQRIHRNPGVRQPHDASIHQWRAGTRRRNRAGDVYVHAKSLIRVTRGRT